MVTVTALSPSTRSSFPTTTTVANSFEVSTETSTELVSGSTVTMSPEMVSTPSTEMTFAEASLDGTRIVTLYSAVVTPSGAVTVTISSFSPAISLVPPTTWNVDSDLAVSTTTSTEVTPPLVS